MKKITLIIAVLLMAFATIINAQTDKYQSIFQSEEIYNAVIRELNINYVDTIDNLKLTETAIGAMLYRLDPYTNFIPAREIDEVKRLQTGEYGGIGAVLHQAGDYVQIRSLVENGAAHRVGLHVGDCITAIDGKNMKGKKIPEVRDNLLGTPGTEIEISVKRQTTSKTIKFNFKRENIEQPPIPCYGMLDNNTAIIVLQQFTIGTADKFKAALNDLYTHNNVKQLVIDLRQNGGGLIDEAVNIAGLFVDKNSEIVTLKGRTQTVSRIYRTPTEPQYKDLPLVMLVDEGTASSSEILAGSLQDLDRAVILGNRTLGKGLVQQVRQLPHDNSLKITTAKYYIPSGRCIQAIDYALKSDNRNKPIPDSLTHAFKTHNGRVVRDGCGILPDSILTEPDNANISYQLYAQDFYARYAIKYYLTHPTIAQPNNFVLNDNDYQQFVEFVKKEGFKYELESRSYLTYIIDMAKSEGKYEEAKELFEQLRDVLVPDIDKDMQVFKEEITYFLESEIIMVYYYQRGYTEFRLRDDKWAKTAINLLNDKTRYNKILDKR